MLGEASPLIRKWKGFVNRFSLIRKRYRYPQPCTGFNFRINEIHLIFGLINLIYILGFSRGLDALVHSKNTRVKLDPERVHWGPNSGSRMTRKSVSFPQTWQIMGSDWPSSGSLAPMDPFRVKFDPGVLECIYAISEPYFEAFWGRTG